MLHLIQTHIPAHEKDFLPIITRETPDLLPKPDPAGILHIAQEWKVGARAEHLVMVFDAYLRMVNSKLIKNRLVIASTT